MKLSQEDSALFALVRSGLWERQLDDTDLFPLTEEQWDIVFKKAQCQTVIGLVFKGITLMPDCLLPPEKKLFWWTAYAARIEQRNQAMNAVLYELNAIFTHAGLAPILLKGQGVAQLYESPQLRVCGDIDLYFSQETERMKAVELLKWHAQIEHKSDGSYLAEYKGICVELHQTMFDMQSPWHKRELTDMAHEIIRLPEGGVWNVPAAAVNLLMLNWHIMRHALCFGVGLRQCCDLARAYYRLSSSCDTNWLNGKFSAWGLQRWNNLLHTLLVEQLGLPEEYLPSKRVPISSSPLLKILLRGGNFGLHTSKGTERGRSAGTVFRNNCMLFPYLPMQSITTLTHLFVRQFK